MDISSRAAVGQNCAGAFKKPASAVGAICIEDLRILTNLNKDIK